jgi:heavy metal translocating P-type ATPase
MARGSDCCAPSNSGPGTSSSASLQELTNSAIVPDEARPNSSSSSSAMHEEIVKKEHGLVASPEREARIEPVMEEQEPVVMDYTSQAQETEPKSAVTVKTAKSCCGTATQTPVSNVESHSCCTSPKPCANTLPKVTPTTTKGLSSCFFGTSEDKETGERGCCASKLEKPQSGATVKDWCCASETAKTNCNADVESNTASDCEQYCCGNEAAQCGDGCCDPVESECGDGCCAEDSDEPTDTACCVGLNPSSMSCKGDKNNIILNTSEAISSTSDQVDFEKGNTSKEHIVLSVSGMTCTGCETKLKRVLGSLNYVSSLKTSLVMARAELDISNGAATADDVIKHLHRTTEFKCEIVSTQGCSLDLVCSGDPSGIVASEWPTGILEVTLLDKTTIRVGFDAGVLGARDLMEHDWTQSLRLASPRPDLTLHLGSRHVRKMGFMTLLSAILTIPVLVLAWAPLPKRDIAYGSASLALATIVQVIIAGPFYPKAIKALVFSKVIEMDLLIVLSTSAAYIFSVVSFGYLVAGSPLSTGEFFETSTLLVTLIMVGRWVASLARQKAAESISIRTLQAQTAVLVGHDNSERKIDARLLQYGDIFKVVPDTRICTDGTVILGDSEVDESMLTGESKPVEKHAGSTVIAGSINGLGMLTVRLTRLPGDNTITTIACMVDEAKLSKPKIQDIADTIASYFVPVVIALATITFAIWIAIGVAVRHQSGSEAIIQAITYAITVLIVSCPCAIGLAVPMVIVVASGVAAKRGVIFKTASSIEIAHKTTDVVFDKTGTLTLGRLSVAEEMYFCEDVEVTKAQLRGLVADIKHPVSNAVATHLSSQQRVVTVQDAKAIAGKGVEGKFKGQTLRAGNSRWLDASSNKHVESMLSKGLTAFCFTIDYTLVAVLGLQDTLRHNAITTVSQLRKRNINVHILSGDDDGAVQAIASQLNISTAMVRSRCSPADKQAYIKNLFNTSPPTSKGKKPRKPVVMFVGDGTNDAVALAQATIGVHISGGTDIAQSAADVVLIRADLSCVLTIVAVSSKAMNRVAFNFGWSFVYNLFAVLLGAGAFVNARIPPEYAGLGELVSVLPVIIAAVLLRWARI